MKGMMKGILRDINAMVGVKGSFVADGKGEVLALVGEENFLEDPLSMVSQEIIQTVRSFRFAGQDPEEFDLSFQKGRVVAKLVGPGILVILCSKDINIPLLNLTADVAARRIERLLESAKGAKLEPQELEVEYMKGLTFKGGQIWVDEELVKGWGLGREESSHKASVRRGGKVRLFRLVGKKGLGRVVRMLSHDAKKLGAKEGDRVQVYA